MHARPKRIQAAGCDASPQMIEQARANAAKAQVNVRFEGCRF
jgi:23S rRNA G2445 N2-methylase RlmL